MKREHVLAATLGAQPDPQPVGMDVVGAEHVAGAVPAVVVGALAFGAAAGRPAGPGDGAQADCPIWSKLTTTAPGSGFSHNSRIRAVLDS